jgi:alkylation response protein AidB-like acyl-CoA dehydrogenase
MKLDKEQKMILDEVRRLVRNEIAPRAMELDEQGGFPHHTLKALAENDLLNPILPAEYGGVNLSYLTFSLIMMEIAKACASSAVLLIAQTDGILPIVHGGSPALKERYLSRLKGGSTLLTALAATEPNAGSDLLGMETEAVRRGDRYIVNGQKCFISNGALADFFVLYAFTDRSKGAKGISAFVVEKTFPGLSYGRNENKMGMKGSVTSQLFFKDLEVPADNLVGSEGQGFTSLMQTLAYSRFFCAAQATGIAQGALDEAVAYAKQRVQFGKPIGALPAVQFMIADMAAAVESSRALVLQCATLLDGNDLKKGAVQAAMAKVIASDAAMKVTCDAIQVMGGYGYMKDYPVERMMRDAKLTQIYTGTNQIMRLVIGRSILGK